MDITNVFTAFIALLLALLSAFVIPWLRGKMSAQDLAELLDWANIAVMAAQQLYHTKKGEERKQYVLDFLEEKGFDIDDEAVNAAIEAAVLKLHQELEGA